MIMVKTQVHYKDYKISPLSLFRDQLETLISAQPSSCSLKYLAKIMNSHVMVCRFLEYCGENNATVDVERKEKVEDIADTLRGLKLLSAASSGTELILISLISLAN